MKTLNQVIADAQAKADTIIEQSKPLRDTFAAGRPNGSEESTVEGTLKALEIILGSLPERA